MIKAIETVYKGYRMRSRLEARHAVFFDALELEWEYEKEGFVLPDGTKYLPDFWLPALDCWLEVKGQDPTKEEQQKLAALISSSGKQLGIIRSGTPDAKKNMGYAYWAGKFIGFQVFIECLSCGTIGVLTAHPETSLITRRLRCTCWSADGFSTDTPRLMVAYTAARQARFEYGEHGKGRKRC